jgi:hypothetical protein
MNHSSDQWAARALKHARVLAESIGPRGATSDGERRAAEYVRDELKRIGAAQADLELFQGAVSAWLPWAITFSLAAWAMFIGLVFGFAGGIVATVVYLIAAWTACGELCPPVCSGSRFLANRYPVRRWLWRGDSQNVLGMMPPAGAVEQRVVLMSYLDSARTSLLCRAELGRGYIMPLLFCSLLLSAGAFLLGALTSGVAFYFFALLLVFPQIAALVVAIRSDRNLFSPGANNNASGLATLLALAERLKEKPLAHTEVWLLATGCRETGCDGLRAFCSTHSAALVGSTFIALEGVGRGERVVYLTGEGAVRTTAYNDETLALAARAAERCQTQEFSVRPERHQGRYTEMGIIARGGFKGTAINTRSDTQPGIPGRCRTDDTFDTLKKQALSWAHTYAWTLLQEIDNQP